MKKIMILFVALFTTTLFSFNIVNAGFRMHDDVKVTTFNQGVRHTFIDGRIEYDGTETKQKINYLGANVLTNDDLHIVVGDNYTNHDWGKGTLNTIINNVNIRYPNYEVIGGVNGDFYGTNGIPIEAYVRNFEVLSPGLGYMKNVIGFKDDGTVVFGDPCYQGYELLVFNEEGALKKTTPIEGLNTNPSSDNDITVYYDGYVGDITGEHNKVVIKASETKKSTGEILFFGKGTFESQTSGTVTQALQKFVIVGTDFNDDELITETDYVVIQQKMGCDFEGVRFAIGAWAELVKDGVATEVYTEGAGPTYRHPRTALGVKADGTVFFVVVDGRDYDNGYLGVTHYELAEIMLYFGAEHAYNLDGGGSTTMALVNENSEYVILNTPSDGSVRAVSNGVFIVKGEHIPRETVPFPDTRETLLTPDAVYIDEEGNLVFNEVDNATGYMLSVNNEEFLLDNPSYQIDRTPGTYEIKIKALGDNENYKSSAYTEIILYTVYTENIENIINTFINYTENEIND